MRSFSLLLLPFTGLTLFIISLLLPNDYTNLRYTLMVSATLFALLFYIITLVYVTKTFSRQSSKKIFWLIAIICVPVIGNVIYVIFHEMADRRQRINGWW